MTFALDGQPIVVRPFEPGDTGYVFQTWMRSFRKRWATPNHHVMVRRIIEKARVVVACPPDTPSTIYGWACGDDDCLHYAYVPIALRGQGLARELIKSVLCTYPNRIEVSQRFKPIENSLRFVHNPHRAGAYL